jgi:RND superfamily putative drug exporter
MGLPILTAVLGLVAGLSLITLAGHLIEVPTLAGGTVVIALCSLVLAGISEVSALGYTAAIVVVTAVLAAITLLPALLALLGSRVNPLAIPVLSRRHDEPSADPDHSRGWQRWGEAVARRPWVALVGGIAILLLLCAPATALHLGQTDGGDAAKGSEQRRVFDLMSEGFGPGSNGQLVLVVDLANLRKGVVSPVEQLAQELRSIPGIAQLGPPIPGRNGKTALVEITPTTAPASPRTEELVERIRRDVLAPTLRGTGVDAYLGGKTAVFQNGWGERLVGLDQTV